MLARPEAHLVRRFDDSVTAGTSYSVNWRAAILEANVVAKVLSTKDRKKLGKKSFALPGKRKYPIPDKAHARNALARVAQNGTPAEQKKVKAAVKRRFPSIGRDKSKG